MTANDQTGLVEWTWNDGIMERERRPACLIITAFGEVYEFIGSSIPGVVRVTGSEFEKKGKWSNTTYKCASPRGTKIYSWFESWEEGVYWPQASWNEAIATVAAVAPQVNPKSLMDAIREGWKAAAAHFDGNATAISRMST